MHFPYRAPSCHLVLAAAISTAALPAQALPATTLLVGKANAEFSSHLEASVGDFVQLQAVSSPQAAGIWSILIADLRIDDPSWSPAETLNGWGYQFVPTTTSSTVAELLGGLVTDAGPSVLTLPVAVHQADHGLLWTALGSAPTSGLAYADLLYRQADPAQPLKQLLGANPWPTWLRDEESAEPCLNLDSIVQTIAWSRVSAMPAMQNVTQDAFFNSSEWVKMLQAQPLLTITIFGLRSPLVVPRQVPLPGEGLPPGLQGFPNLPPKLSVSQPATIRVHWVGSGQTGGWPRFHAVGAGQPLLLPSGSAGGVMVVPMSGFVPTMQLGLLRVDTGHRLETTVQWHGFGELTVPIPATTVGGVPTPTGSYDIAYYRHPLLPLGSGHGPWQVIPAAERKRVLVN